MKSKVIPESEFEVHVHACSSKINHHPEMCAQKCPLNVQIAFKYTKIYWRSLIS